MLYDPERRWIEQGICNRPGDLDYFFADGGPPGREPTPVVQAKWDRAKEVCKACPVLAECQRDTLGEFYGVWGGLDQYERHKVRKRLSAAVKRWSEEERLAWGEELSRLRDAGLTWTRICAMASMTEGAGEYLVRHWKQHQEQLRKKAATIVDLPLPEPARRAPTPFPERPGRCHVWVRRKASNLIADGWYKGETSDGAWIYIQFSGRASSYMWARAEDVKIYHPQPATILNYIGRPDRDDLDETA